MVRETLTRSDYSNAVPTELRKSVGLLVYEAKLCLQRHVASRIVVIPGPPDFTICLGQNGTLTKAELISRIN